MRVGIYDEAQTLYGPIDKTMPPLKQLHVQEVRLNLYWGGARYGVAQKRPANATNPADPAYDWELYDRTVRYANAVRHSCPLLDLRHAGLGERRPRREPRADTQHRPAQLRVRRRQALRRAVPGRPGRVPAAGEGVARVERAEQPDSSCRRSTRGKTIQCAIDYAKICNAVYHGVHATLIAGERVGCGVTAPRGNNNPSSCTAVRLAARVPARRQEGRPEDASTPGRTIRTTPARPTRRRRSRLTKKGAPPTAVTLGNLERADEALDPALRQQAHLDHRVRLPDEPARPALRRLVREAGCLPDAGVRDRAQEPAHRHDALVPAQGRAEPRGLAVGAADGRRARRSRRSPRSRSSSE